MKFLKEEFKSKYGIYGIINHLSGDVYVGQTSQPFQKRFWHHQWKLRNGTHDNQHLQNAWNLYGEEYFSFIPIQVVDDSSLLDDLEVKYINIFKEMNRCYNIIEGGNSGRRGIPISEEQKRLIAEKNRINMTGKKHSEETKQKMSESRKGKIHLNSPSIILTPEIAYQIKARLIAGEKAKEIAVSLDIDYKHINNIIANNTWSSVEVKGWDDFLKNRKTYNRLTKQDHQEIYRLYSEEGYTKYQLAEMYGKGVKMIERILRDGRKAII